MFVISDNAAYVYTKRTQIKIDNTYQHYYCMEIKMFYDDILR